MKSGLVVLSVSLVAVACSANELTSARDSSVEALSARPVDPVGNPSSLARHELGRLLFWDPILSGDRDVACATCHHPDLAYADGRELSIGVGGRGLGPGRQPGASIHRTPRNSMTVLNTAYNGSTLAMRDAPAESAPMFWDSRDLSLETQAIRPIANVDEMRGEHFSDVDIWPEVVSRLSAIPEYTRRFEEAFGPGAITPENIGRAIASFERTLVNPSSFDRYMAGDDSAISHDAKRGLAAFINDGCSKCHSGPMFSDFKLHRIGVPDVPGAAHDVGDGTDRFRTPSLRNVTRTAPYMHNGSRATLADVLRFYTEEIDTSLDPDLPDRFAQRELATLEAFFESLSDGDFDRDIPASVPSGLPPGGSLR